MNNQSILIEKLKPIDMVTAAEVYQHGAIMQIPPSYFSIADIIDKLHKVHNLVYKKQNEIHGLISFISKGNNNIQITFICSIPQRIGIGKRLLFELATIAKQSNIAFIYSTVSFADTRAIDFYHHCGFRKYGQCTIDETFTLFKIKAKPEWIKTALNSLKSVTNF